MIPSSHVSSSESDLLAKNRRASTVADHNIVPPSAKKTIILDCNCYCIRICWKWEWERDINIDVRDDCVNDCVDSDKK